MVQWVQVWYFFLIQGQSAGQNGEQTDTAAALQLPTKAGWFEKLDTNQNCESFA